jgi:hypothetical protein
LSEPGHNGILADRKAGSLLFGADLACVRRTGSCWREADLSGSLCYKFVDTYLVPGHHGEEEIRIISARKASARERTLYYSYH